MKSFIALRGISSFYLEEKTDVCNIEYILLCFNWLRKWREFESFGISCDWIRLSDNRNECSENAWRAFSAAN